MKLDRIWFVIMLVITIGLGSFTYTRYPLIEEKISKENKDNRIKQITDTYLYPTALLMYYNVSEIDPATTINTDSKIIKEFYNWLVDELDGDYFNSGFECFATYNGKTISNTDQLYSKDTLNNYQWYMIISFDENGDYNIKECINDISSIEKTTLLTYADWYNYFDEYLYNHADLTYTEIESENYWNEFYKATTDKMAIKDMEFFIGLPKVVDQTSEFAIVSQYIEIDDYLKYIFPILCLCISILMVITLFTPFSISSNRLFKLIAEIKFIILAGLWCAIQTILLLIGLYVAVDNYNQNLLYFFKFIGMETFYPIGSAIANIVVWSLFYFFFIFLAYMIRYLFHKGLVNYIKENGLIYACYQGISSLIRYGIHIDFESKPLMFALKVSGINLLIIYAIHKFWYALYYWNGYTGYSYYSKFEVFTYFIYALIVAYVISKQFEKIIQNYTTLINGAKELSKGNFLQEIEEDTGIFNEVRDTLNDIHVGFESAVKEEAKAANMRTELITNVSHDLKTPLTSMISYIDLLKQPDLPQETRDQYIETLSHSAYRLKNLVQDLFDVSKANSGNLTVDLSQIDIISLIKQVAYECEDHLAIKDLQIIYNTPDHLILNLDGEKTYRIFENLLINVSKYALEHTRVYITVENSDYCIITIKNISATELNFDNEHIVDRFVQGDKSRNTQGSGLGLAIVKSFVEIQHGTFRVETDGDLFKAIIEF